MSREGKVVEMYAVICIYKKPHSVLVDEAAMHYKRDPRWCCPKKRKDKASP